MTAAKPVILTFVAYYLPGYKSGGPVRTIANMVEQLGDQLDFRIVTADRDSFDTASYPDVLVDSWNTVGKAQVFYASSAALSLKRLASVIRKTPHDILYLNSFFRPSFTVKPLLLRRLGLIPKRRTIIAARGEFSQGALALKSWRKRSYLTVVKAMGLYRDLVWQASSDYEAADITNAMGLTAQAIMVAPDLPPVPRASTDTQLTEQRAQDAPLRVCFLSRIDPKKNLDYALRVLSKVDVPVEFSIYGLIENDQYWGACQNLCKQLPSHVTARYHGVIDHARVPETLAAHDLFFLPTRGENYGHVIHEALAAGVPVLISDQTPWRRLESLGIGWDLPLDVADSFRKVIESQAALGVETVAAQRQRAKDYAKAIARDGQVLDANLALFTDENGGTKGSEAIGNKRSRRCPRKPMLTDWRTL